MRENDNFLPIKVYRYSFLYRIPQEIENVSFLLALTFPPGDGTIGKTGGSAAET